VNPGIDKPRSTSIARLPDLLEAARNLAAKSEMLRRKSERLVEHSRLLILESKEMNSRSKS
jgi:hypothetical protein